MLPCGGGEFGGRTWPTMWNDADPPLAEKGSASTMRSVGYSGLVACN